MTVQWQVSPLLCLEYARQSVDGRLTLVIVGNGVAVPTMWVELQVSNLKAGIEALREREGTNAAMIGRWTRDNPDIAQSEIGEWGMQQRFDAVVWTALPPRFGGENNRQPSADEACAYLASLCDAEKRLAEEYIRRTPPQVRTRYRAIFETKLGWSGGT